MGVATEPYRVPSNDPCWAPNNGGSVAIYWRQGENSPTCQKIGEGRGFVMVEWGPISVLGCYISLRLSAAEFEQVLDGLENAIRTQSVRPVIVAG